MVGVAHLSTAAADQSCAQDVLIRTFGPKAIADKSVMPCLQGEVLGWTVDLEYGLVRPNDKAIRKLMWAFFTVDMHAQRWPLQQCQMRLTIMYIIFRFFLKG